jgi:hypothetical protein
MGCAASIEELRHEIQDEVAAQRDDELLHNDSEKAVHSAPPEHPLLNAFMCPNATLLSSYL